MASLGSNFDPTAHDTDDQRGEYENLPDGIYRLEISASETKIDREKHKAGASFTIDVIEPEEYKGRKIFSYINIEHPNVQAQEIGQKELAMLCRACGVSKNIDDTEELHLIAFTAKVGMGKPSKDKDANGVPLYPAKNEIKKYFYPDTDDVPAPEVSAAPSRPANDNRRPAPAAANQNKPAPAAGATKRPWGNK